MKKNINIITLLIISFGLMAFGYLNWNNSTPSCQSLLANENKPANEDLINFIEPRLEANTGFIYNIDTRFIANISKEDLHNAKSVLDILPKKEAESVQEVYASEISIITQDATIESASGKELSDNQLNFIQSIDYSTNILAVAHCILRNDLAINVDRRITYAISVVPEKKAEYSLGKDALIGYLRQYSKEATGIIEKDKLKPGRIHFTVTKEGKIANVLLDSTSGYPTVDNRLIDLINKIPGSWKPASNAIGENVDQELVFFFGIQGC